MNKTLGVVLLISALISLYYLNIDDTLQFINKNVAECSPRQIRINLGDKYSYEAVDNNDITVTFHTYGLCANSSIKIYQNGIETKYNNHLFIFQRIVNVKRTHSFYDQVQFCHKKQLCEIVSYDQYIHHFLLPVKPGAFDYIVYGDEFNFVKIDGANAPSKYNTNGDQTFLFVGDLDQSPVAEPTWKLLEQFHDHDAVIYLGDYAYEFWQSNGTNGDEFMEKLQPFASKNPWMIAAGNHEDNLNYTFYNEKYRMPNYDYSNNHYYSFDVGKVHFIQLDLHFYNDGKDLQTKEVKQQMRNWLEEDLQTANLNRQNVPWVVIYGHKAIYCFSGECEDFNQLYHHFDDIFYKYGVDLFLGAHKHEYQMMKPIYKTEVKGYEQRDDKSFYNPQATLYVIQGNAGNKNGDDDDPSSMTQWLTEQDVNLGLGRMIIKDANTIILDYIRSDTQRIHTSYTLYKSNHDPFPSNESYIIQ